MQLNLEQQTWAISVMHDCCGIEIDEAQLMTLLQLDPGLLSDIVFDLDTIAREHLMSEIAQQLGFSGWVSYGDSEDDRRAFFEAFPKRAIEHGYRLVEGYWAT